MKRGFVVFALLLATVSVASAGASSKVWTGYGAKLSDWKRAHPKNLAGCPAGTCYGPRVRSGGIWTDEFIELYPDERVSSYTQNLSDGTPLAAAKVGALSLMPSDAKATGYWTVNRDGQTCAYWNLRSRTLAEWRGHGSTWDRSGDFSVELGTIVNNDFAPFSVRNVNQAIVQNVAATRSLGC